MQTAGIHAPVAPWFGGGRSLPALQASYATLVPATKDVSRSGRSLLHNRGLAWRVRTP